LITDFERIARPDLATRNGKKTMEHFERQVRLPVSIAEAFAYHQRPGALQRLLPPWQDVSIAASDQSLTPGSRVTLKIRNGGIPVRWVAEHTVLDPPHSFVDIQRRGPFAAWTHRHQFVACGEARSELTDAIDYALPLGGIGQAVGGPAIRRQLDAMFAYRHNTTMNDLQLAHDTPLSPQRIAVSGSTGLLGSQLCPLLTQLGHTVDRIVRQPTEREDELAIWDPSCRDEKLQRLDAVIHLAGKPIAAQRWTPEIKKGIRESRVLKTRDLCERLARLETKPHSLLCASATGFYGDRGDEVLTEQSSPGHDFLAGVAEEWEEACRPAVEAGIRVVHLRFGLILSPRGGALEKDADAHQMVCRGPARQRRSVVELDRPRRRARAGCCPPRSETESG
jgi:ligand-binding SRPBCC domain-containing protein